MAKDSKGKRRLCIDLSRCYNKGSKAPGFRIESTREALQVLNPNDWMFSFNLKSAYYQIPVNENYWKYLGFAIQEEYAFIGYFCYKMLPFGLNDAWRSVEY